MFNRDLVPKQPFREEFFDLVEYFGIKNALKLGRREIDQKFIKKTGKPFDLKRLFAWKILRDPYYKLMVSMLKSFAPLYDAGFFMDALEPIEVGDLDFQPGECRTPIEKVSRNLAGLKKVTKPVVLLCTGAFSPIHNGHIGMMHKARKSLEQKGFQIIGGYLSPSHDDYVSRKIGGEKNFSAAHRVYLCQAAVTQSDWLLTDPWESRYLPTDINFTDVILRLENYLNHYLKPPKRIRVAYVFGADNAAFSDAFRHRGLSVCVARSQLGATSFLKVKRRCAGSQAYFTQSNDILSEISSTKVRKWKQGLIPESVTRSYFEWRMNYLRDWQTIKPSKILYVLRDDRPWALKDWKKIVSPVSLIKLSENFLQSFNYLLKNSFERVLPPDKPMDIEVAVFDLNAQQEYVAQLEKKENLINLDICTNEGRPGAMQISRQFVLCNGQIKAEAVVPRPGFEDIDTQISKLKSGEYTIIDDDIASGTTMSMFLAMLPERVRINKIRTLSDFSRPIFLNKHLNVYDAEVLDMVDLRDFIFGAKAGGLACRLPNGKMARAPYSLPYISLVSRACLPPSSEMRFSKEVWRLNFEFFSRLDRPILIKHTDKYFREFCKYLGFSENMPMAEFCQWHINNLLQYI